MLFSPSFALGVALILVGNPEKPPTEIEQLIKQLGHDQFKERDAANKRLAAIGDPAFVPLVRAARTNGDPEIRMRARDLAETIGRRLFGEIRSFQGHQAQISCLALSGDGKRIFTGGLDHTLRCWEVETGKELHVFSNQPGGVWAVALSRDGKRGLSSAGMSQQGGDWIKGTDFAIYLWDLEAGKVIRKLEGHTSEVRGAIFSADERRVLSCGWDMTLRLWDLETGKEIKQFKGHTGSVRSVAFSRDGKRAISASKDKTVRVWDLETGKEVRRFEGHNEDVFSAVFTPDGQRALSAGADHTIRLWEVETGKEIRRFEGHTTVIWSIALSPDGKRIVSAAGCQPRGDGFYIPAGKDHEVRFWDLESGLELFQFTGHTSSVMGVVYGSDGRRAFSASTDGTVRMWKIDLELKK